MGSGEGDAIRDVKVWNNNSNATNTYPLGQSYTWPSTTTNMQWSYSTPVYYYQIKCPKRGCKTYNWLELNKVKPCTNCSSKLRAIAAADVADFETVITT